LGTVVGPPPVTGAVVGGVEVVVDRTVVGGGFVVGVVARGDVDGGDGAAESSEHAEAANADTSTRLHATSSARVRTRAALMCVQMRGNTH